MQDKFVGSRGLATMQIMLGNEEGQHHPLLGSRRWCREDTLYAC